MAKKEQMARSFARTAPKSQEKYLIENAKKLRENPSLLLPQAADTKGTNCFKKIQKQLDKIYRFRDNEQKLEKLSNKKGLDGALAGTLLLTITEKAPYLGVMKFSIGDVTFAQRGKADKEKLIAAQHFDDPILRLFGIRDFALKKKLHVYSWDTHFVCTGKTAQPPHEFIQFLEKKLDFPLQNNTILCPHLTAEKVKNKEFFNLNYLRINWESAHIIIGICDKCASSTKNTMFEISKYILTPNLSKEFDIDVLAHVISNNTSSSRDTKFLSDYLSGAIFDLDFIQKNAKSRAETVKQSKEKLFVYDGTSYGTNIQGFISALQPNEYEEIALQYILEKLEEPLIVSRTTANKILEKYWDTYGKEFLESILHDTTMADSFARLDDTPSNILTHAFAYLQRQDILSKLPQFSSLPPFATYLDRVARIYKTFGEQSALQEIRKRPENPKGKSLAYAFLLTLGKGTDTKWQYSKEEIEYGEYLQSYARKLLDAEPENYIKTLQELLTICGSSETITL